MGGGEKARKVSYIPSITLKWGKDKGEKKFSREPTRLTLVATASNIEVDRKREFVRVLKKRRLVWKMKM